MAAVIVLQGLAFAQSPRPTPAAIEGIVNDPSGRPVAGAQVTVTNLGTNFTRALTTDAEGRFRGLLLPLGPYKVTFKAANFGTLVREGLDLAVGQTISLSLVLSISQVEQVVSVSADAPILESSRVESSTYLDQRSVHDLPNNGRNFLSLVPLTPGVSIVQGPDGDEISINGQKGINNNVSIDGADNNNPFFGEQRGGQRPAFTVSLDAIKEFQVVAEGAPAEFGRSSGGFINVVTKSGTNALHGTLHQYHKWTALTSRLSDGTRLSAFSQEQFGGTVGGAIKKDKLFYFVAYDQQFFTQTKQNNANRMDPALVSFFATKLSDPNENGPITRDNTATATLGKIDWYANPKNLFTACPLQLRSRPPAQRHLLRRRTVRRQRQRHRARFLEHRQHAVEHHHFRRARSTRRASSSPVKIVRAITRVRAFSGRQSRPLPDTGIDFVGQYRFGLPFFIPVKDHDTRFQLNDNVSLIHGAHNIKFGAELNRTSTTQTFLGFANGRYIFDSVQGFMNYVNIGPKFVECSNGTTNNNGACPARQFHHRSAAALPPVRGRQREGHQRRRHPDHPAVGARSLHSGQMAGSPQSHPELRPTMGCAGGTRPHHARQPGLLRAFYRQAGLSRIHRLGFPLRKSSSNRGSASSGRPARAVQDAAAPRRRHLLRAHAGPGSGEHPVDQWIGGPIDLSRLDLQRLWTHPARLYDQLVPNASSLPPDHPQVYVTDKNFTNPRTYTWSLSVEQALTDHPENHGGLHLCQGRSREPLRGSQRPGVRLAVEQPAWARTRPTGSAN